MPVSRARGERRSAPSPERCRAGEPAGDRAGARASRRSRGTPEAAPADEDLLASGSVAPAPEDPLAPARAGDPLVDAGVAARRPPTRSRGGSARARRGAAAAEVADAAPAVGASTREPSGFLDLAAVRTAAEESGLKLPDSVYAGLVAALATGKHLVLSGPAGSGKCTLALAIVKAAVQAGRSQGAALATASPRGPPRTRSAASDPTASARATCSPPPARRSGC